MLIFTEVVSIRKKCYLGLSFVHLLLISTVIISFNLNKEKEKSLALSTETYLSATIKLQ